MELLLTHVRVLLAVIVLIVGSVMVSGASGLAGQTLGTSLELGVADDGIALPENSLDQELSSVAATDYDSHQNDCMQDCSMHCASWAGSGCCTATAPIGGGGNAFDRTSIAAYGMPDAGLLATGIDPEALLHPPRSYV
ncbi:hypothetical protein KGO5_05375 [Sinorhizobium sp. KGO-5]|uniref:hypothetical protein n=1 Tax=Sinorhizobium sp. KGO-5 TaxID=1470810 RepID=UPI00294A7CF3|nr:hypothetical protein KGO5_05375 [Sinorhizobium sp. KGO-5]